MASGRRSIINCPETDGFEVLRYSQQSTGFTRYASLNLEERLASELAEGPIDIAVISFGANDTQGIYANGHGAALLTPGVAGRNRRAHHPLRGAAAQ